MRNIVFHVSVDRNRDDHLATAIMLALKHGARLIGVYSLVHPTLPTYAAAMIPPEIFETQRRDAVATAEEAERQFLGAVEKAEVEAAWLLLERPPGVALTQAGRAADLVLLGQPELIGTTLGEEPVVSEVVMAAGRPVLMLPRTASPLAIGGHVAVAWSGTRESARALGDAMPWLESASRVSIVSICDDDDDAAELALGAGAVRENLAARGITASLETVRERDAGGALTSWAKAERVGLLVAGAYGHSRFREWVLGGVTEALITHARVPVLFSH